MIPAFISSFEGFIEIKDDYLKKFEKLYPNFEKLYKNFEKLAFFKNLKITYKDPLPL